MATFQSRPVSSFAAIQAEEQARAAHRAPAAGPPQDGGDDGFEEELARAMRESLESSAPAATAPAAAEVDGDYALALALAAAEEAAARESAAAASGRRGAPGWGGGHATVKLLSQLEHSLNAAVSLRSAAAGPQRTLYSADDADALRAAAASAAAGDGGRHEAALALAQATEADDDELRRALRGRGLARLASDSHDERGGQPTAAAGHAGSKPSGAVVSALVSKHDSELSARLTARRLERDLGPVAAGELCAADGAPARIAPSAVVSLKRHLQKQQVKGTAAHGRVEAAHHATHSKVLDRRTMLLLHKLIASGRLGGVGGVVKEGKESVVFRGEGWSEEVHRELAGEGWSGVKAQVWEGDEEEEDESEGEGPAEEGEEEEEGEGTAEGEAEAASAAPSAATGSAAAVSGTAPSAAKAAVPADSSDLYSEFTSGGVSDVAVKVFKTTLNEFSNRKAYMDGDRRFSRTKLSQDPRKVVPLWAEKEFTNLIRVHRAGIPSPAPLLLREHVMVMEFLGADGWPAPQLREAGLRSLAAWSNAYLQVVSIMSALYKWAHLVHADLSEYNLLYWEGRVHVIDLGQAVDTSHPRADELLAADAANITAFFERQGVPTLPPAELVALVKDPRVAPHPPSYATRTGSAAGTAPAPGSGLRLLDRQRLAAVIADDATRGVVAPVASACDASGAATHATAGAASAAAEGAAVAVAAGPSVSDRGPSARHGGGHKPLRTATGAGPAAGTAAGGAADDEVDEEEEEGWAPTPSGDAASGRARSLKAGGEAEEGDDGSGYESEEEEDAVEESDAAADGSGEGAAPCSGKERRQRKAARARAAAGVADDESEDGSEADHENEDEEYEEDPFSGEGGPVVRAVLARIAGAGSV